MQASQQAHRLLLRETEKWVLNDPHFRGMLISVGVAYLANLAVNLQLESANQ